MQTRSTLRVWVCTVLLLLLLGRVVVLRRLAACILRAHADPCLWADLSAGGLAHAAGRFSLAAWRRTLAEALWVLDVPAGATPPRVG